jgi:16S rRNA (adenine(1408)-N(1))-methyltransferase
MRERLPNLVLLREPAESIPLESFADEVTIHFPWGSLLRGALAEDESVFAAICRLPRPGGRLTMLLSVTAREGREPLTDEDRARVARAYRSRGLTLTEHRAVVRADVDAARSSWGKRLDVGGTRPGELLRFVRGSAAARAPVPSPSTVAEGGHMSERRPVREEPRIEEHKVYALLAIPIFLVTVFIIALIAMLGTVPRP